jgi:hypothetical protein
MSRRIEVREEKKDRYWVLRIDPVFDPEDKKRGFQPKVTAYSDQDYSFEDHGYHWKRAEVSWYSIGSVDIATSDAYAKAIAIATEHARKMNTENRVLTHDPVAPPTPVVTIVLCSWCTSIRPIEVHGVDTKTLPPGRHDVKMQLSHGMCVPCGTKFSEGIGKGGVTQGDTPNGHTSAEGKT